MLWFLMDTVEYSQSSENSKFVMSLQYLKEVVRDEVDFLDVDKLKVFYKVKLSLLMDII